MAYEDDRERDAQQSQQGEQSQASQEAALQAEYETKITDHCALQEPHAQNEEQSLKNEPGIWNWITDKAQQANLAEWAMVLVALGSACATITYAIVAYWQWQAMSGQLAAMKNQLGQMEVGNRPWIAANISLAGPLVFDANGAHVTIRIDLRNVGHSVALNVMPNIGLFGLQQAPVGIRKAQRRICKGSNAAAVKLGSGYAIFPETEIPPIYLSPDITPQQINEAILRFARPGSRLLYLHILGCISYGGTFGRPYQTGVAFELAQPDPAHPGAMLPTRIGNDIPLMKLHLFSEFVGAGNYAN